PSAAEATPCPGEHRGTYPLPVRALAPGSIAAAADTKASLSDTVAATPGTFTFQLGATGAEISVSVDGSTTLSGLAKAINDKNAGVRATVVNTGTSATPAWKLSLVSSATGAANDIAIVHDDPTLGVANTQNA